MKCRRLGSIEKSSVWDSNRTSSDPDLEPLLKGLAYKYKRKERIMSDKGGKLEFITARIKLVSGLYTVLVQCVFLLECLIKKYLGKIVRI